MPMSTPALIRTKVRRNVQKQAKWFADEAFRTPVNSAAGHEYKVLVQSGMVTDPMGIETSTDHTNVVSDGQQDRDGEKSKNTLFGRWDGLHAFVSATFCNFFDLGSVSLIFIAALKYKSSSLVLILSYIGCMVFVAIPVLTLEHKLGKIMQGGILRVFCTFTSRGKSVGIASIVFFCFQVPRDALSFGRSFVYFVASFRRYPPWAASPDDIASCNEILDETSCNVNAVCGWADSVCKASAGKKANAFYDQIIAGVYPSETVSVGGTFNIQVFCGVIIGLALVALLTYVGLRLLGQLSTFALICSVIYLVFLVTITYALDGSSLYFWAEEYDQDHALGRYGVFVPVLEILLSSFGLGYGAHYSLASFNSVRAEVAQVSLIVGLLRTFICFLFALTFVFLEGYAKSLGKACVRPQYDNPLEQHSGLRVTYETFPALLGYVSGGNVYAMLFYLYHALFSLISLSTFTQTIIYTLSDLRNGRRSVLLGVTVSTTIVLGLSLPIFFNYSPTVTTAHAYAHMSVAFLFGYVAPVLLIIQQLVVTISWGYEMQRCRVGSPPLFSFLATYYGCAIIGVTVRFTDVMSNQWWIVLFSLLILVPLVLSLALPLFAYAESRRQLSYFMRWKIIAIGDQETLRNALNDKTLRVLL
eukprot:Lankesteria_metandrocarpae@DN3737_c0_g1_i2.p1